MFRHSYSRDRAQLLRRLSRIEGQVRGIARVQRVGGQGAGQGGNRGRRQAPGFAAGLQEGGGHFLGVILREVVGDDAAATAELDGSVAEGAAAGVY